ncbi:MAG: S8 family serine peptidase, partial [Bacteroidota bacterium]
MLRNFFLFFFLLGITYSVFGQQLDHVQGEVIVQMRSEAVSIQTITNELAQFHGRSTAMQAKQCLSEDLHIWILSFDFAKIHERRLLAALRRNRLVQSAQFNHFIQFRNVPNDPDFLRQWEYINDGANGGNIEADLDADLAWDLTTGGLTANGDTIVLAALDNGVDLDHEDLVDNIWRNHREIPDNGIDDDNNGYVDDYFGIDANVDSGAGDVGRGGDHGTSVMGVMGAKGNNGIGVTGVNWDVKLMMIKTDFETTEGTLIRGFGYPLALRKKYNETNGQEGAFVVATNNSWGVDNAFPEDAPIWCSLYDSLGAAGILSTGATANAEINVDASGDLPTTCPSDFMIGVTSLNRAGRKVRAAGFGQENIDIGAFGERVYNVAINNGYELTSGTSLATPQVAGAIGLLYAAPCRNFSNLTKSNPAQAALLVREYILNGAKPNSLIDTLVATGGQLNLNNSLQLLMQACGSCPTPLAVTTSNIIDVSAQINWVSSEVETKAFLRYRPTDIEEWIVIEDVRSPFVLSNLSACTNYEFQLNSECMDEESGYIQTYTFKTDGCCETPTNIRVETVEDNAVRIAWDALFAAQRYEVQFNQIGSNDLNVLTVENNFVELNDLATCT